MAVVKTEEGIRKRIREIERRLSQIDSAAAKELERPFFARQWHVMDFFDLEKRTCQALLRELRWQLHE
jgi:hypothetical protein